MSAYQRTVVRSVAMPVAPLHSSESLADQRVLSVFWVVDKACCWMSLIFFTNYIQKLLQIMARSDTHRMKSAELIGPVSLYRGEPLPGFYDEWIPLEREHLDTLFERQMGRLVDRLVEARPWPSIRGISAPCVLKNYAGSSKDRPSRGTGALSRDWLICCYMAVSTTA
jgi:hypothetical protein